jgi:hypothetical protein
MPRQLVGVSNAGTQIGMCLRMPTKYNDQGHAIRQRERKA